MRLKRAGWLLMLGLGSSVCLAASSGCSEPEEVSPADADSLAALGVDDGASLGAETKQQVTPDRDATLSLKTGAQVKINTGSVAKQTEIGLKRPPDKEALELVKGMDGKQKLASAPYVITPHQTTFSKEVEVTLPIAKDRNPEKLKVAWLATEKDTEWKVLGTPKTANGKATIKVDHFSVFMLIEVDEAIPAPNDGDAGSVVAGDGDSEGSGTADASAGGDGGTTWPGEGGISLDPDSGVPQESCSMEVDYGNCGQGLSVCAGPFTTYTCSDGHTYSWGFGGVLEQSCELQCEIDGMPTTGPTCIYESYDCDLSGPLSVCRLDCGFPSYVGPQETGTPLVPDAGVDSGTGPVDSGTGPVDSGTGPVDSGTAPVDSGMMTLDASQAT